MSGDRDLGPVEESLRRSFAPPDLSALEAKIDAAARAAEPTPAPDQLAARRRKLLLAAVAVAAAAAVFVLLIARADEGFSPREQTQVASPSPRQTFGANLAMFVSDRQLPSPDDLSCLGARRPPDICVGPHSKPWLPASSQVQVLGECGTAEGPACEPSGLLAGTGLQLRIVSTGARVFVCMDLLSRDPRPLLPEDSGLQLFRRVLGDYVMYEVTPLSEPHVLELFRL